MIQEKIKKRDNYKCLLCDSSENLEVHHIKAKMLGGTDVSKNLVTLCKSCHVKLHTGKERSYDDFKKIHRLKTRIGLKIAKSLGKITGRPSKDPKIYTKLCSVKKCRVKIKKNQNFCDNHKSVEKLINVTCLRCKTGFIIEESEEAYYCNICGAYYDLRDDSGV